MYNRPLVFSSACIGMLLFGVSIVSLGTVNAFLAAKFSLTQMAVGSLAALLPFGILTGSVVFGPVVDRYGYRFPLIFSSLFIFAGFEMIAFTLSFAVIQSAFFLVGLGGGVLNGGTNALVADITTEGKGASLSLLGVFFGVGALGMPALTGLLLSMASYETIIACVGLGVLIPVSVFAFITLPAPKQARGFALKNRISLLKHPALLLLSFALFFQSGLEGMANNWGTMYLQYELNMPVEHSLFGLTLLAASLTLARLFLGFLLRRYRPGTITITCIGLTFTGGLVLGLASATWQAMLGFALIGVGFAPVFPVVLGFIGDLFADLSGTAFGVALVIALSGSTILNYSVGALAQSAGIGIYPWIHLGATVALALLFFSAKRRLSKTRNS
jgi:FHS family glucose/mannose:H+ symporter-like MFS transporter